MSTLHIKQLPRELAIAYAAGTNLLLLSKPAVGKSMTVESTAEQMAERIEGFKLWRFDMTTANPNDLMAYMPNEKTHKLECYENAGLPNGFEDPEACGFVFIDEVLNGDPTTVKVFQKYINGEKISERFWKPKKVVCIMASNRLGDKAGVMQQSRAFLRRTEQLEIYSDATHNLKYAENDSWWPVLLKFLEKFPALIDNYDDVFEPEQSKASREDRNDMSEEGKRGIWANMASWKRISMLEYAARSLNVELNPTRCLSNVGKGVGQQYVTYRAMFDKIASVDDILKDPKNVPIPSKIDELFVTVCMLAQLVPQDGVKQAGIFIDRLSGDIRVLAIRRMVKRSQKDRAAFDIGATKEYRAWMQDPAISDLLMAAR